VRFNEFGYFFEIDLSNQVTNNIRTLNWFGNKFNQTVV
jgi:hypothetical protein